MAGCLFHVLSAASFFFLAALSSRPSAEIRANPKIGRYTNIDPDRLPLASIMAILGPVLPFCPQCTGLAGRSILHFKPWISFPYSSVLDWAKKKPMPKGRHFYSILLRHYGYCSRNDLLEEMLFHNVTVPVPCSAPPPLVNIHDLPWAAFFFLPPMTDVGTCYGTYIWFHCFKPIYLSPSKHSWSAFTLFYLFSRIIRSSHQALEAKCTNEYFNHVGRPYPNPCPFLL